MFRRAVSAFFYPVEQEHICKQKREEKIKYRVWHYQEFLADYKARNKQRDDNPCYQEDPVVNI